MKILPFDAGQVQFCAHSNGVIVVSTCYGIADDDDEPTFIEEELIPWDRLEELEHWIREARQL